MIRNKRRDPPLCLLPLKQPSKLADLAYQSLKETILSMDYNAEERLDERKLAQSLNISRTPLRDAINRLVSEGFLRVEPRKGIFINRKSRKEIIEILYVRAALEGAAAKMAAQKVSEEDISRMRELFAGFNDENIISKVEEFARANVAFHEYVLQLSGNRKLQEFAANIYDHMRMVRLATIKMDNRAYNALREHLEIIAAFEKRDGELARTLMQRHIEGLAVYVETHRGLFPFGPIR